MVKSELVKVELIGGTEQINDRAAAVKATMVNGREDYIIYATNPDCTYYVDDLFEFKGFTGVVSVENGEITYAWGCEAQTVADVIVDAQAEVSGTVLDFTKGLSLEGYTMTINMESPVEAEDLANRWIYVETDGIENGAYCIYDAEVNGNTAVLDLKNQTLVRKYVDAMNIDLGYIHNIEEGAACSIPLSCYGTELSTERFNIAGANMTLGNDLKMNFLIKKTDLQNSDGFTAVVKQEGKEPVTLDLWEYNSSYYAASYSVAAKEMTDVLSVQIFDGNGRAVSNHFSRTVKQYAMTLMGTTTAKSPLRSVVVDMLNYGTEAQKYFSYHEDAYANADLTAAQQEAYATGDVQCTNRQEPGENFVGANLSLEDRILLNVFFKGITGGNVDGMTATISYTDYKGNSVSEQAVVTKYNNTMAKVVIDRVVLADSKCPVTVTVYRNGVEFGSCVESVESYVARNLTGATADINMAIMKFATSAYTYLS